MRQGQQNRRGRGRNRKTQNPLTRSFESNGPDVKIRGTPAHIAEKYMALARDAASSQDHVLEQNYLQHAEHYNRIIMAFREQQMQQSGEMNGMGRHRPIGEGGPEGEEYFDDEGGDELGPDGQPMMRVNEPQPAVGFEGQPRFDNQQRFEGQQQQRFEGQQRYEGQQRFPRRHHGEQRHQDHRQDNQRQDHQRHDRHDRHREREQRFYENRGRDRDREHRPLDVPQAIERAPQPIDREPAAFVPERPVAPPLEPVIADPAMSPSPAPQQRAEGGPRRRERVERVAPQAGHEQPDFLRRPVVRRPRRDSAPQAASAGDAPPDEPGSRE